MSQGATGSSLRKSTSKSEGISAVEAEVRFNAIVEEYGKYLRNVIGKLCPTDMGIQYNDIEQEARIRLWRALQSGKEILDPASYIYRIAVLLGGLCLTGRVEIGSRALCIRQAPTYFLHKRRRSVSPNPRENFLS